MRDNKGLGHPQLIALLQYRDCIERTKKKVDLKGTDKLVRFMLEESSIVQPEGAKSYSRTRDAIRLINEKLCPGQWCTRTHCDHYSSRHAWNCSKTKPSVCRIYKKYIEDKKERDEKTKGFKKCDICGKSFTGNHYSVIDENYKVQKDLIQCANCYATQCAGE